MTSRKGRSGRWQLEGNSAEAYERYLVPPMFTPWADRLVERVKLRPGERALDVACGTGIVARRAADVVGPDGSVVGLDVNEDMLEVARETSAESDTTIEWRQGDAAEMPFSDGSFDVAFCQQALQFLADPAAALREMRRVLGPDGRLAVSVWRPIEFNPGYVAFADALERHVGEEATTMMRSPFPSWDRAYLRTLVSDAGLREASVTVGIGTMRYPSPEEFVRREAASSPLAGPLGSLDPAVRETLIDDVGAALGAYTDDDGVVFPMESYEVVAQR